MIPFVPKALVDKGFQLAVAVGQTEHFHIAGHVAVDGRPAVFHFSSARDLLLHSVPHVPLPIEPVAITAVAVPAVHVGQQVLAVVLPPGRVAAHQDALPHGVGQPTRVHVEFGHRSAVDGVAACRRVVVAPQPSADDAVGVASVAQPPCLHHVMSEGAGDEIVAVGITARHEKLRHGVSRGRLHDVLAQRPPAVVEHFLHLPVRAIEERNVALHPVCGPAVGDGLYGRFVLHGIEPVDIVTVVLPLEQGRRCVLHGEVVDTGLGFRVQSALGFAAGEVADGPGGFRAEGICLRKVLHVVGRCIDRREGAFFARTETDARDRLQGGEEHLGPVFLAVNPERHHALPERDVHVDVVGLARLVLAEQGAVASARLDSQACVVLPLQTGAGGAVTVLQFYLQPSAVVLPGLDVEADNQFARSRDDPFGLAVVEGVGILQLQRFAFGHDRRQDGRIDAPGLCVVGGRRPHWHGDAAHPDVFLVDGIGDIEACVLARRAGALQRQHTASVLRTVALVLAAVAHGRHLAIDEVEGAVVQSVCRERDGQRPAEFRRIVDRSVRSVGQDLPPYLGIAVDKAFGTPDRLGPGLSAVEAARGEGVLPEGHQAAVGQRVIAEGLVDGAEGQSGVATVALFDHLHPVERIVEYLGAGFAELAVFALRVERVARVGGRIVVVVVEEIDGAKRTVAVDFAHHAADAVAVVGVVFRRAADAVVAQGEQLLSRLGRRDVPTHTLVHHGCHLVLTALCGIDGEENARLRPVDAVGRTLQQGPGRVDVFGARVAQVV